MSIEKIHTCRWHPKHKTQVIPETQGIGNRQTVPETQNRSEVIVIDDWNSIF